MDGLVMKRLATVLSQKSRLVPLYHQSALRVIRAMSLKNVLASH
jgi:hypothetical protein